jgi:hypothetical protein
VDSGSGPNGNERLAAPVLRVVRGVPTAQEVAALVGVLLSRRAAPEQTKPARPSLWRAGALRDTGPRPGPGAWRASGLPG